MACRRGELRKEGLEAKGGGGFGSEKAVDGAVGEEIAWYIERPWRSSGCLGGGKEGI